MEYQKQILYTPRSDLRRDNCTILIVFAYLVKYHREDLRLLSAGKTLPGVVMIKFNLEDINHYNY